MTVAVLYRWRVKQGMEDQFEAAWAEGTRVIHQRCGSFGARLHKGEDGLYWSYALWPDDETRKSCFQSGVPDHPSFARMQDAVAEYLGETVLAPAVDLLDKIPDKDHG
jgi:heme-degrading monooxygenase HmoA